MTSVKLACERGQAQPAASLESPTATLKGRRRILDAVSSAGQLPHTALARPCPVCGTLLSVSAGSESWPPRLGLPLLALRLFCCLFRGSQP